MWDLKTQTNRDIATLQAHPGIITGAYKISAVQKNKARMAFQRLHGTYRHFQKNIRAIFKLSWKSELVLAGGPSPQILIDQLSLSQGGRS